VTFMALNISKEEFVWSYIKYHNVPVFKRSYEVAQYCHRNHFRQDGTPYFGHPNELCYVLLINNMEDEIMLSDGICHDIVEECRDQENIIITKEDLLKEIKNDTVVEETFITTKPYKKMTPIQIKEYFSLIEEITRLVVNKHVDRFINMRRSMFGNFERERLVKYDVETVNHVLPMSERIINSGLYPEYENILRMLRSGIKGLLEGVRAQVKLMNGKN